MASSPGSPSTSWTATGSRCTTPRSIPSTRAPVSAAGWRVRRSTTSALGGFGSLCPFIAAYIRGHQDDYLDLVVDDMKQRVSRG